MITNVTIVNSSRAVTVCHCKKEINVFVLLKCNSSKRVAKELTSLAKTLNMYSHSDILMERNQVYE